MIRLRLRYCKSRHDIIAQRTEIDLRYNLSGHSYAIVCKSCENIIAQKTKIDLSYNLSGNSYVSCFQTALYQTSLMYIYSIMYIH